MNLLSHIQLMSQYNQGMNHQVYEAAAHLSEEKLSEDKGAFFGSILGTFNHLMVADIIWLKRFSIHPTHHSAIDEIRGLAQPSSLDQVLYSNFPELAAERRKLDETIMSWCNQITESDLQYNLSYKNMKGQPAVKAFGSLILHFFNHQTHHRGQVTTLLSQEGLDVGVTDLLAVIPNELEA
ncbi:MAG: DinB family protein [Cyanobacteriota bacterium]